MAGLVTTLIGLVVRYCVAGNSWFEDGYEQVGEIVGALVSD